MTDNEKMKPNSKHMDWADKILNGLHVEDFSPKENIAEIAQHLAAFEAEVTQSKAESDHALGFVNVYRNKNGDAELGCTDLDDEMMDALSIRLGLSNDTTYLGRAKVTLALASDQITLPAQPEKEGE